MHITVSGGFFYSNYKEAQQCGHLALCWHGKCHRAPKIVCTGRPWVIGIPIIALWGQFPFKSYIWEVTFPFYIKGPVKKPQKHLKNQKKSEQAGEGMWIRQICWVESYEKKTMMKGSASWRKDLLRKVFGSKWSEVKVWWNMWTEQLWKTTL